VTHTDIVKGQAWPLGEGNIRCYTCPVARAIKRTIKRQGRIGVMGGIVFVNAGDQPIQIARLPSEARMFATKADNLYRCRVEDKCEGLAPFTFTLTVLD
jgi:hypothetical protein